MRIPIDLSIYSDMLSTGIAFGLIRHAIIGLEKGAIYATEIEHSIGIGLGLYEFMRHARSDESACKMEDAISLTVNFDINLPIQFSRQRMSLKESISVAPYICPSREYLEKQFEIHLIVVFSQIL